MALCFATGSLCFLLAPLRLYADLVGPEADALTFLAGSLLFTAGGAQQVRLAWTARGHSTWVAAVVQSAGTLLFNVTTSMALSTALSNPDYDRLVWRPDAVGSVCFLASGWIALSRDAGGAPRPLGGGGQISSAASCSGSRPSRATSCPSEDPSSISPRRTGAPRPVRRASSPAPWRRCAPAAPSRRRG